jgi:hypothetical protein
MKQKKEKVETPKFYSLSRILAKNADYNVIFGERSNGKTYATLLYGIKEYLRTGKQMAYIRRWREDLRGKDFIVANPWLKLDKTYKIDSDIVVINNTPFADSILPVIGKYGVLYTDAVITLNMTSVLTRITMLISASDDKTKQKYLLLAFCLTIVLQYSTATVAPCSPNL